MTGMIDFSDIPVLPINEKGWIIMLCAAKKEFIEFMMQADVLRFGSFVTKSGRQTPYFVNTGKQKNFR